MTTTHTEPRTCRCSNVADEDVDRLLRLRDAERDGHLDLARALADLLFDDTDRAATADVDTLTGTVIPFDRDQQTEVRAVCIDTDAGDRERVVFVGDTSYTEVGALLLAGLILDAARVLSEDVEAHQ